MAQHSRKPLLTIVDDEPHFSESLQMALEDAFDVSTCPTLKSARELFSGQAPDAVLLDLRLPDGDGFEFLQEIKDMAPMPVVIIMTAYATIDNAVKALKEGAVDYFTKPLDIEKLRRELGVYLENRKLLKKIGDLDREIKKIAPSFITAGDGKMKEIVDKAPMVAPLNIPVLITGETGTGKEKLAQWLHALSGLSGEMIAVNCSALPREILESEFFGHVKGAFSGALANKDGIIERAKGGTLFLDEIGELPEDVQAKFLRVLEDGVYYKVGDPLEHKIKFRLIAATNKDLTDPANRFRTDLFYRINGITFNLPPLRERTQDIPLLTAAFIKESNYAYNKNVTGIAAPAMERIMRYGWPGNIRELRWCIHRAVAIATVDLIDAPGLAACSEVFKKPAVAATAHTPGSFRDAMEEMEKKFIEEALEATGNNKTEAAKLLNISVRVLHYKIKRYGL